ncbi:MAG: conjugal transfer protein TraN [Aliarcobacter sp.]|nr:conjugal transfer protein TraN [Aliarcobacter sp.]
MGNFCSKKLKLGLVSICVQKSDSYCSFNSSLGKIIQEQGRTQLGISWGVQKIHNVEDLHLKSSRK